MNTPQAMDREWEFEVLFKCGPDYLCVERQAAEGWLYTLYRLNHKLQYDAINGGTIPGRIYESADCIAADAAEMLDIDPYQLKRTKMLWEDLAAFHSKPPDFEIQGVPVYLDPEIKQPLPDKSVGMLIRRALFQLTLPVLIYQNDPDGPYFFRRFEPHERRLYHDQSPHIDVPLKNGLNRIYAEQSININAITEDSIACAMRIWYEPIYVSFRFMNDISCDT